MKISYNWLKQFIKIDLKSEETAALLTYLGLEVETVDSFQSIKGGLEGIVVGEVLTCEKHPDADRLKVTTVNIGEANPVQIVCGAPNVAAGQKVPVATIGTKLFDKEGVEFQIKKGKIRGQESHGMICAEDELGIGENHDGIMILDENLIPGTTLASILEVENDEVFEIGLTPNRADAMSHWGVARDLRAGMLMKGTHPELITPSVSSFRVDKRTFKVDIEVKDNKQTPRYCGLTISGITIKPSPSWLQNRLKAIGISPKNNVVDVTNYVLHELGQPLHAFDASKINGKILVQNVASGTKFTTLDDVERSLHEEDIMICDEKGPLCIAGVLGGKDSGVSEKTTNIFLESAYFNPVSIRKTAKRHGLSTDASFRFERGIDPTITEYALKRAAILIQEVAGGEITSDIIEYYPKKMEDFTTIINFERINKLIGQELPKETIKKILVSLDIKINSVSETGLGLVIPAYRVDVQREVDIIEEILRIYGYNNIKFSNKLNATVFRAPKNEDYKIQNIVGSLLNANGFHEMMSNSLTTPIHNALIPEIKEDFTVKLLNPLSSDLSVMRQTMVFSGLESISYNINRKNSDLKFFEFGKTYHKMPSGFEERKRLSLFMTGQMNQEHWNTKQNPSDFFYFKGYIETILNKVTIHDIKYKPIESDNEIYSEGLMVFKGQDLIATLGVLKKTITKNFDIKQTVFYADLDWALILKSIQTKIKFQEISKYQEVRRDLALLIDQQTSFEQLHQLAFQTDKKILKEVNLFDVYEGKNLPEGKKSYALSFILQNDTQTLTDTQIDKVMQQLQEKFETEAGAVLR
jgi:phenylalanyl-tRNA synthetase beta chain